jgi:hypothetical protein
MSRLRARHLLLALIVLAAACSAPPEKEMSVAQGAIEAARAAGAEQYAAENYRLAVEALERSRQVALDRDYRLSLNLALDARERAIEAAKEAAQNKGTVRLDVERMLAALAPALTQAEVQLGAAETARVPAESLVEPRQTVASATQAVQEARAALEREDYLAARGRLEGLLDRVIQASAAIEAATTAARQPRRRR